ncbi:19930_t:CDS:1, partial [Racocetra persica]
MSKLQKWWNADSPEVVRQLAYYYDYVPELSNLSLESHSLCSSHYSQIASTNQFYERLVGSAQESVRIRINEKDNP